MHIYTKIDILTYQLKAFKKQLKHTKYRINEVQVLSYSYTVNMTSHLPQKGED